jgi:hypothetical protein
MNRVIASVYCFKILFGMIKEYLIVNRTLTWNLKFIEEFP